MRCIFASLALLCALGPLRPLTATAITITTVPIGNPGNANDSATGNQYGGVAYNYNIGKYEVTVGQYTAFLNAVAATDTYSLYVPSMATDLNIAGIARGGSSGSYTYSVIGSPNRPATYVTWGGAARFSNWLHNGQPTGAQGPGTTETGAYTLNGAVSNAALLTVTRNPGAKWFIPSESEWYKVAYYQPTAQGGDTDNYWEYPTRTNNIPYSAPPPGDSAPTPSNTGNFEYDNGYAVTGSPTYISTQNYLTDVGAYSQSSSFYGSFDQGGSVWEWNEAVVFVPERNDFFRGVRGGGWERDYTAMGASHRDYGIPSAKVSYFGFRVASTIPEPSTAVLAVIACGMIWVLRMRFPARARDRSQCWRMDHRLRRVSAAVFLLCAVSAASVHAATFTPLGDLPGGAVESHALGVSSDGRVVVGQSSSANGTEAFRWTAETGMVGLGDLPGGDFYGSASHANSDGTVIVGGFSSSLTDGRKAFRWTAATGMVDLGFSAYGPDVSDDGKVVVGGISIWSESAGIRTLPGNNLVGVSADGSVVVGTTVGPSFGPFRWTSSGGLVRLTEPNDLMQTASAVSGNGSVVGVDEYHGFGRHTEYRWTKETGLVELTSMGAPRGISDDGSVMVDGYSYWTQATGGVSLRDALIAQGVKNLDNWSFSSGAGDVSADGLTIVGTGVNPAGQLEGWVARLDSVPEPATIWLLAMGVAGQVAYWHKRVRRVPPLRR